MNEKKWVVIHENPQVIAHSRVEIVSATCPTDALDSFARRHPSRTYGSFIVVPYVGAAEYKVEEKVTTEKVVSLVHWPGTLT